MDGAVLFQDVRAYDDQGEHRTGTAADGACSDWLVRRLALGGLQTSLQAFPAPLFEPRTCRVDLDGLSVPAFPAWPVRPSSQDGLTAPMALTTDPAVEDKIVLVRLPYASGGTWARPGFGDAVMAIARRRPAAIVAVTEAPTGQVIALNAAPERFDAPVPVVIVGDTLSEPLWRAAASGASATLVSTGRWRPSAEATNVIARRKGSGKTLVVSTPKSGWFHCAGERGTGIAIFIALAHWLARNTDDDLLFVAFSGHELDELGGHHFLNTAPPAPDRVRCWLHIGANAAMRGIDFEGRKPVPAPQSGQSLRIAVTPDLLAAAQRAYPSGRGYAPPMVMDSSNALGELGLFQQAGYHDIAGLGGPNAVFHTELDRAPLVTTPKVLEDAARACRDFLMAIP
jgi:hypothetical protein